MQKDTKKSRARKASPIDEAKKLNAKPKIVVDNDRTMIATIADVPAVMSYLSRVGAVPRGILRAAVRERNESGYYENLATIRFNEALKVTNLDKLDEKYQPDAAEEAHMASAALSIKWPSLKPILSIKWDDGSTHFIMDKAPRDLVTEFKDRTGRIIMVEVRVPKEGDGKHKDFYNFIYMDVDGGKWVLSEPEQLPIWNAENIRPGSAVFLHEGVKAAKAAQAIADGFSDKSTPQQREASARHPWGEAFAGVVNCGWVGGALNWEVTDWTVIRKIGPGHVCIVPDNDLIGSRAVPHISKALNVPTTCISWSDDWPSGFDLADDFPPTMFGEGGEYIGSTFEDCIESCTWLTDMFPPPKGQKGAWHARLREHAANEWYYVSGADLFVNHVDPRQKFTRDPFNRVARRLSDVRDTADLISRSFPNRVTAIACPASGPLIQI